MQIKHILLLALAAMHAGAQSETGVHCQGSDGRSFVNQCVIDMFAADPNQNICGPCGCSGCPLIKPLHVTDSGVHCRDSAGNPWVNQCVIDMYSQDPTQNICGPCGCSGCPLVEGVESLQTLETGVHCTDSNGNRWVNQCVIDMFNADPNQNICGPCGCSGCPLVKPLETHNGPVYCEDSNGNPFVNQCVIDMFTADPTQNICGPCGCSGCPLVNPNAAASTTAGSSSTALAVSTPAPVAAPAQVFLDCAPGSATGNVHGCCHTFFPNGDCPQGYGDCNLDSDCADGLVCVMNVGNANGFSQDQVDVCLPAPVVTPPAPTPNHACPALPTAPGCYVFQPTGCVQTGAQATAVTAGWYYDPWNTNDSGLSYDACANRAKTNSNGYDAWCATTDAVFYYATDPSHPATRAGDARTDCGSTIVTPAPTPAVTPAPTPVVTPAPTTGQVFLDCAPGSATGNVHACCTTFFPNGDCPEGYGDCGLDSDCADGLVCVMDVGNAHGFSNNLVDVCLPPTAPTVVTPAPTPATTAAVTACPALPTAPGCYVFQPTGCIQTGAQATAVTNGWYFDPWNASSGASYDDCANRVKTDSNGYDVWCATTDAVFYYATDPSHPATRAGDARTDCGATVTPAPTPNPTYAADPLFPHSFAGDCRTARNGPTNADMQWPNYLAHTSGTMTYSDCEDLCVVFDECEAFAVDIAGHLNSWCTLWGDQFTPAHATYAELSGFAYYWGNGGTGPVVAGSGTAVNPDKVCYAKGPRPTAPTPEPTALVVPSACPALPTAPGCYVFQPTGCIQVGAQATAVTNGWYYDPWNASSGASYDACADRVKTSSTGYDVWCATTDAVFYYASDPNAPATRAGDARTDCNFGSSTPAPVGPGGSIPTPEPTAQVHSLCHSLDKRRCRKDHLCRWTKLSAGQTAGGVHNPFQTDMNFCIDFDCAHFTKKGKCRSNGCTWSRTNGCGHAKPNCAGFTTGRFCRQHGCQWARRTNTCSD